MKIALSGSHGTGKTFSVFNMANDMKLSYPNADVEVLTEVARKCPLKKLNKETTKDSQLWMYGYQIKEEINLSNRADILICDRSLLDYIVYTSYNFPTLGEKMYELAKIHMTSYDYIYFKSIENNDYMAEDGIRENKDKDYRKWIEDKLVDMYFDLLSQSYSFKFKID